MEKKKFNRSEHMKAKYAERRKKMLEQGINQENKNLSSSTDKIKKQIEKEDKAIKAQIIKEKRKIYSARAYQKRKQLFSEMKKDLQKKGSLTKTINSDSKSLIFKINNSEQKEITIRIDV
jgi:hypothetical protein